MLSNFIFVFRVICAVETSVRHSVVRSNLPSLAAFIEGYSEDKGRYPASFEELTSGSRSEYAGSMKLILNDQWKDQYEYRLETNGFTIRVNMPIGLFVKKDEFEGTYKIGDALKSGEK